MNARDAIERLVFDYAWRLDAGDFDGVAALFTHATYGRAGGPSRHGADAVRATLQRLVRLADDGTPRTKHVITNLMIDVEEDGIHAGARSYFTVLQATTSLPLQVIASGRYQDRFECADGIWRFTARGIHLDATGDMRQHLR